MSERVNLNLSLSLYFPKTICLFIAVEEFEGTSYYK